MTQFLLNLNFTDHLVNVSGRTCKIRREVDQNNNCKVKWVQSYPNSCECTEIKEYYLKLCDNNGEKGQ